METESTLEAMRTLVEQQFAGKVHDTGAGKVLVINHEQQVHDLEDTLDKHRAFPKRSKGTSTHETAGSLIAHAKRSKREETVAFCTIAGTQPSIVVVYDYHPASADRGGWNEHKASYQFPLSDEWRRWSGATNRPLSVSDFAQLLEDGINDVRTAAEGDPRLPGVTYANPTELLALAQGLTVRVDQRVVDQRKRDDGTFQLSFAEQHTNEKGEPLRIPNGFLLGIPVFVDGPLYAIPVRLRYRIAEGKVLWTLALHNADTAKREAVTEAAEHFASETSIPVFFGTAEK